MPRAAAPAPAGAAVEREPLLLTVYCRTIRMLELLPPPRLVDTGRRFELELELEAGGAHARLAGRVVSCERPLVPDDFGLIGLGVGVPSEHSGQFFVGARFVLLDDDCLVGHCQVIRVA